MGMLFLTTDCLAETIEADEGDWLWWQLFGSKAITQLQSPLTWLRPCLQTSSKLSSIPFSRSALSPRQLNEKVEQLLARFRREERLEEVWLETSSLPNPPSFSGFREYSFLQGLLCLFVGRSIPLPAGIELAIHQQEAFHGSPTNTCPWGIICS